MNAQHERRSCHQYDRGEIFDRVVRQLADKARVDDKRSIDHADGLAIRRCARDDLRADDTAAASAIVYYDLLTKLGGQVRTEQP